MIDYARDVDAPSVPSILNDRLPPQNLEAERGVLGGMLLDDATIDDVSLTVNADDFYRDSHQTIYRAIVGTYEAHGRADTTLVADWLEASGDYAKVGGVEALADIIGSVPHAAHARFYAGIVREKSDLRRVVEAGNRMIRDAYSNLHTAEQVRAQASAAIDAISERAAGGEIATVDEAVAEAMAIIAKRKTGEIIGVPTGWERINTLLGGGLANSSLTIVAGRPSSGKTAWALNLCDHVAFVQKCRVLLVSLEMKKAEVGERLIVTRSRVFGNKLKAAWELSPRDDGEIARALREIRGNPLEIADESNQSMARICAAARMLKRKRGVGLVVIDYVQLIDATGAEDRRTSRQEVVSAISRRMKVLARELDIPVVALAQLNRELEKREGNRPRMSDLRESGSLEQDADNVVLLHRPDYFNPDDKPNVAEVIVAKQRNGATGMVELRFNKPLATFEEIPIDYGQPPAAPAVQGGF